MSGIFEYRNTTSIPDGDIEIRINVTDSAGFTSFATRRFRVDNTLPLVILDSPINQSILEKPNAINLTVTDTNLDTVEWRANVSPG